ncbi:bifunctional nuclease family protein [Micrococcus terreus]|uniref:bifunctional nuclease family protein n=1 Tax=Micrococcus terreus TaxID=574650 RepID=UPI0021A28A7F|nr:bifunctional nuclease family protein [Micrococcus terreus]MCT2089035.1 bifunctional nuclease family protein [Micrococcus terreus]
MSLPDIEMTVLGIRVELPANQPLVLLQDPGVGTVVPIWIGAPEASAIAQWQQGLVPPRPLTHDLVLGVLEGAGTSLESVRITSVDEAVFHAELVLSNGCRVDARASDAIACALRAQVPVLCAAEVLESAGVELDEDGEEEDESEVTGSGAPATAPSSAGPPGDGPAGEASRQAQPGPRDRLQDQELDEFRRFLESVDPDDFADGEMGQG